MRNRNNTLKAARILFTAVLAVVLLLANDPAMAWGKKKKESPKEPTKAVNLDKHPTMNFYKGVLHLDVYGEWHLDQRPLSFNRNSRISETSGSNGGTTLVEGRTARVTAANINGILIVHRVTMITPDEMLERGGYSVGKVKGEPELGSSGTPQ